MSQPPFPSPRLRRAMLAYRALWLLGMPLIIGYLLWRARRDRLYAAHMAQRFGLHRRRTAPHIWVHAVSLGELRSAVPLIRALLARGEHVVTTHFTPAGLREARNLFGPEIERGTLSACYVPFDDARAFRRFFRAFRPKYGLVMEIEFWPGMIMASRRFGVPLLLCNGQYPTRTFERDRTRHPLRAELVRGFAGVMVKSEMQAARFRKLGQVNVAITGEMRFEQAIPPHQTDAAAPVRRWLGAGRRPVITIASAIEGEDALYARTIADTLAAHDAAGTARPFFVYVPRAPERFDTVAGILTEAGLRLARRSAALDAHLAPMTGKAPQADVLLGDSMGEMYFYLAMADRVIVGGGFHPKGAHNVIEPLALRKPVLVGPHIWTIEYPAQEAIDAGVLRSLDDGDALTRALAPGAEWTVPQDRIERFFAAHAGAVDKTLTALPGLLRAAKE
ncbi:MAG: 3-deoxy-D-manno-octulosonic acid transferase [Sediminimonas qiaohouensis]|uniref:3-deoxy-D-manno-octulosonic acid transferase n=1 Tax=Sediminimonas qiaohouensis TaxID=552061 RepID=A0A7C9L9G2_9RHOB|nr:glycosyltransferase N-terminal domain-containing protein [Sediminimonas qiaohouensis]MTJ03197.1 3-deoxy-D-manno-octulosonic acid transferase [Sediminimonas qiaohouensis]